MMRGVNAWFTRPRSRVCSGGSWPSMLGARQLLRVDAGRRRKVVRPGLRILQDRLHVGVAEDRDDRQLRMRVDRMLAARPAKSAYGSRRVLSSKGLKENMGRKGVKGG